MKKILISPWTAIATLLLVLAAEISGPTFVESIKMRYFDTLITSKPITQNNIYTANIDEAALDKYGQWPFDRRTYAQIIKELYQHHAGLVVFDVLMPEKDRQGGDSVLVDTLDNNKVVLANVPASYGKNIPRNPGSAIINSNFIDKVVMYPGVIANIPEIENAATGVGATNTLPEIDGVNRRLPLIVASNGKLYPNIAIETLRVVSGDKGFQLKLNENGVEKLRIPKFGPITTDALGRIWIDWSQRAHSVSITNLPSDLNGAVVIVGTSAAGIANPVSTAKGAVYPQDVIASVIATLENKVNIQRADWADGFEVIALAVAGLLLILLTRWLYVGMITILVLAAGSVAGSIFVYNEYNMLFDATAFCIGIVLVGLHAYVIKFLSEYFQKQQIKKQFEHYLAPAMVKKLQKNPNLLKLGGDTRELTLLFCDIRGFTPISEQYKTDPQGLTSLINRFLTPMTDIIMKNEGTIDKYMGDCIMAFWNAPLDVDRQQEMAVKSAMEMLAHLKMLNEELAKDNLLPINIGIGINTGEVVVGNMGSNQRFDYSCLGDAVNLAARLEGQSKDYGVKIVLGNNTAQALGSEFITIELDTIAVKGKTEGVRIFTVVDHTVFDKSHHIQSAQSQHQKFLESYKDQRWDRAIILAKSLSTGWNSQLKEYYNMMIKRCQHLKEEPPETNWDGVYRAKTK